MIIEDFAAIRAGMDELRSARGGILPAGNVPILRSKEEHFSEWPWKIAIDRAPAKEGPRFDFLYKNGRITDIIISTDGDAKSDCPANPARLRSREELQAVEEALLHAQEESLFQWKWSLSLRTAWSEKTDL